MTLTLLLILKKPNFSAEYSKGSDPYPKKVTEKSTKNVPTKKRTKAPKINFFIIHDEIIFFKHLK